MLIFISILYLHFIFDLHFVDVLHWSMFFIHICLSTSLSHPSVDYRRVFAPILYFQPSPSQRDSQHFHFQPFRYLLAARALRFLGGAIIFLPRALRFWECIFYPQALFNLALLHRHFNPHLSRPPWKLAVLHYQNNSVLNSTIYYHEVLVVKV